MKVFITENLRIDLDTEKWECRKCERPLIGARENYKLGLLVYNRDPREIHKPLLDPTKYENKRATAQARNSTKKATASATRDK